MPTKPKSNVKGRTTKGADKRDCCGTPPYATELIIPYLQPEWVIWEPCAGEGLMAETLRAHGFRVITSDIQTGQDFLTWQPSQHWDVIVTNPPFSLKYEMIRRAYALGRHWAFLCPLDTLGAGAFHKAAQSAYAASGHAPEVLWPSRRVNYKMPKTGWAGSAQFYSIWLSWQVTGFTLPMEAFVPMLRHEPGQARMELVA